MKIGMPFLPSEKTARISDLSGVTTLDALVLQQLLLLQQSLQNATSEHQLLTIAINGLACLPGLQWYAIQFEDNWYRSEPDQTAFASNVDNLKHFPLHATEHHYGELILAVADADAFAPYESFIKTITDNIVLQIEHRRYRNQLHLPRATDSHYAKAELDLAFQRNQALVKAVGEIVYEWWPQQDRIDWSGEYERILGYFPEEIGEDTQSWTSRVHPDDLAMVLQEVDDASREQRSYDLEYRYRRRDGSYCWMHDQGTLFFDEHGELERIIGVFSDIDRRKQSEEGLRESELRFRQLADNINEVFWLISSDKSQMLYLSPAYERIWGRDRESLYAAPRSWFDAIHPEDYERVLKSIKARRADGYYDEVYRIVKPDASIRWIRDRAFPVLNDAGQVERVAGVANDITEQVEAEAELRRKTETLQAVLDNIPVMLASADDKGQYLFTNKEWENVLGWRFDELKDRTDMFARCYPDPEYRRTVMQHVIEARRTWREFKTVIRDGSTIDTSWAIIRLYDDTTLCIGQDISQRKQAEKALRDSEALYRSFIENTTEGIYLFETSEPVPIDLPVDEQIRLFYQGRTIACNDAMAKMYGYENADQLIGVTLFDEHGGDDKPENLAFLRQWIEAGYRISDAETHEVDVNGHSLWFSNSVIGIVEDGLLIRVWGSQIDITERKQAEEYLRLSASVFENTDEGVIITDPKAKIVDVNRAFVEITGYSREEVLGRDPRLLNSGRQDQAFYQAMWDSLINTGHWRGELWSRRKDGSIYPGLMTISSVYDEHKRLTHYLAVFSDISYIKQSQQQLDHLARHDPLTDLPNRLLLNERLQHAIRQAERRSNKLVVIFLDLDHFKHINDSLGHALGDCLLQKVAAVLTQAVRQQDTVARIGGDEFVLLLEDIAEPKHAANMARKLTAIFEPPFLLDDHSIRVTASLGVCLYPRDGKDADTLLRNADAAMYKAKAAGRNNYHFYTEELTHKALERVQMENNLRLALEREELTLVYQPQLDLQSGRVIGLEALLRWHQPQLGPVSPAQFIPLAEESGLIHPIGAWVLRNACRQGKNWLDRGFEFGRIAVNIAGAQIQRGGLVDEVKTTLSETGLPASYLELEVTEGFIMQQAEFAIDQLNELRQLGITLSIDDFGTGYSSLSYLKQLPIHKLKIDQSFVRDIPDDANDMAISAAVIALGISLNLSVIAEGVTTQQQIDFLRQQGCHEAQGFFYSRPIAPPALEQFLFSSSRV